MVVGPDSKLAGKALADPLDVGRAGHGQAKPAFGAHCQPVELLVRQNSVGAALSVGEGRERQAVLEAVTRCEAQGRKQTIHSSRTLFSYEAASARL